ncbi:hypothetical protein ACLQ3C_19765 [Gordonia sp. DT30]|uniref:hypothetical protein n=1 Tax=unclassified Gordonia (in: high G+C Gram-positive bacteria) TaxID=2657482 RepID=UPI003CEE6C4A
MLHKILTGRRALTAGCVAAGTLGAAVLTAGTAAAAPQTTEPSAAAVRTLDIAQQTPTVGVSHSGALPTGGFVAPLAAAATGPDTTVFWLEPMPANACGTSLRDAKVSITWKNTSTHTTDDTTFPACADGKPALSPRLATGSGNLELTVTVLGSGGNTFTLTPGTATLTR